MEEKRELIIDAATRLFHTYGYNSVTMDDIASEIGMSKRTIYLIFRNKTELVDCVIDQIILEVKTILPRFVDQAKEPMSGFIKIYNFIFGFSADNLPIVHRSLRKYYPLCYQKVEKEVMVMLKKQTVELIDQGIKRGLIISETKADDFFYLLSNQLFGLVNGFFITNEMASQQSLKEKAVFFALRSISTSDGIKMLESYSR